MSLKKIISFNMAVADPRMRAFQPGSRPVNDAESDPKTPKHAGDIHRGSPTNMRWLVLQISVWMVSNAGTLFQPVATE